MSTRRFQLAMKQLQQIILQPVILVWGMVAVCPAGDSLQMIHSQESYILQSTQVSLAVTRLGGHMAPVTFYRDTPSSIQPYYLSPWQDEPAVSMPAAVLVPLRGDFFCLPFGDNQEPVQGKQHPAHGESATSEWQFKETSQQGTVRSIVLTLETKVRPGHLQKTLSLVDGENIVYSSDLIEGVSGRMPLGHHATLAMPDKAGSVRLATSPIRFGMTFPGIFSHPEAGEYQALQPGRQWASLQHVPMAWKEVPDADLSRMPGRYGYADLVQLVNDPAQNADQPAWVTATFTDQNFIWFALKDPALLNSTVLWMENHGRHGHPWNGRNQCLGIEDVTSFFSAGLQTSIKENLLTRQGVPTAIELIQGKPLAIRYIQGVVRIPVTFDQVDHVEFGRQAVTFVSSQGERVSTPVRYDFLKSGKLP